MNIAADIYALHDRMRQWRQLIHQYPETAYEEQLTSNLIAEQLQSFGLQPHRGLAETGVVASLTAGSSDKKIALRADIDALYIEEKNSFDYKSRHQGKMHACGHDGHTAMLLGAAKYLCDTKDFDGTVHFIFQPAEEGRAGAQRMIAEGLFDKFLTDSVYGMHNFPDVKPGHFAVKAGPMMAAFDCFEICLSGCGTHAAMPHLGDDVIVGGAQLVSELQTIVARNIDPLESAVLSITQFHSGNTWNAIPDTATLRGTIRCFKPEIQALLKKNIKQYAASVAAAHNLTESVSFNPENPGYPVTLNTDKEAEIAAQVAASIVGAQNVNYNPNPSMGAEDFAYMLQEKPGCYLWIGNGDQGGGCLLHNPRYDFNDDILPIGAAYWVRLVETILKS